MLYVPTHYQERSFRMIYSELLARLQFPVVT